MSLGCLNYKLTLFFEAMVFPNKRQAGEGGRNFQDQRGPGCLDKLEVNYRVYMNLCFITEQGQIVLKCGFPNCQIGKDVIGHMTGANYYAFKFYSIFVIADGYVIILTI